MLQSLLIVAAVSATGAFAGPCRRSEEAVTTTYACNPAHSYPGGVKCVSTAGALSLVTPSASASSTGYACNPAHSYPGGASCISTAGTLSLVTLAPSSTGYACNPAHSYPGGASCISTAGTLSLVTPAPSSTGYACNPAHSYPGGASCISTAGHLSLVTPAPASSTGYACNPAHSYPGGASCISTAGTLSLVVPTSAVSSMVAGQASASATAAATSSSASPAKDLTWTVEDLSRYCGADGSGCDYNFNLTASDDRPAQACTIVRLNVENAPTESWSGIPCTAGSPINVSWGYSAQFGVDNAFAVMTVVNDEEKAMAYFGVADVNGEKATVSNPFGSGQYGNIGPQPVYLF